MKITHVCCLIGGGGGGRGTEAACAGQGQAQASSWLPSLASTGTPPLPDLLAASSSWRGEGSWNRTPHYTVSVPAPAMLSWGLGGLGPCGLSVAQGLGAGGEAEPPPHSSCQLAGLGLGRAQARSAWLGGVHSSPCAPGFWCGRRCVSLSWGSCLQLSGGCGGENGAPCYKHPPFSHCCVGFQLGPHSWRLHSPTALTQQLLLTATDRSCGLDPCSSPLCWEPGAGSDGSVEPPATQTQPDPSPDPRQQSGGGMHSGDLYSPHHPSS